MLAAGEEVSRFESEFASYCRAEYGVATANGTAALHAALAALGISRGDRVLTTPFSFVATANAVRFCNAEPVFADVDPETFNLDPAAVEERIAELDGGIDAILAVHLYGLPAEMDKLREIATAHDVPLIEDAAQAHGAVYRGGRVGSLGDVACFSFYPTKNMTTGEGGMIVTDRDDIAARARSFINHGRDEGGGGGYEHPRVGHNFRMTNLAAAIGRVQLKRLPGFITSRRDNAERLAAALDGLPVAPPVEPAYTRHVYHQFTVRCADRDRLADHLDSRGVDTGVYYPTPIHEQPPYRGAASAPVAERLADEVLSLPVHQNLSPADLATIEAALESYQQ